MDKLTSLSIIEENEPVKKMKTIKETIANMVKRKFLESFTF